MSAAWSVRSTRDSLPIELAADLISLVADSAPFSSGEAAYLQVQHRDRLNVAESEMRDDRSPCSIGIGGGPSDFEEFRATVKSGGQRIEDLQSPAQPIRTIKVIVHR